MITVKETRDTEYLRRWMLRPAFIRKMGVATEANKLESAFQKITASGARFFDVRKNGSEKGCIVFCPIAGGWDIHTCLSTWWADTRVAIRDAIHQVIGPEDAIVAHYPEARRSIERLLDDLGFSTGAFDCGWRRREFKFNKS